MRFTPIALALLIGGPLAAAADTPPAPAKPQKKAAKPPAGDKDAKVYTNDDLEAAAKSDGGKGGGAVTFLEAPAGGQGTDAASESTSSGGSSEGSRNAASEDGRPGEAGWRQRANEAREAVGVARAEVERLEAKLQGLANPMRQPQPIEALQPDPNHLLTTSEERQQLEKDLAQARNALADAERALTDFQEEARRQGIPSGWIE